MPLWIFQRPPEVCNEHEFEAAECLRRLTDQWMIRWGFNYRDGAGITREGDFLIRGPDGHILILEVKKIVRHDAFTGVWQEDYDSPVEQIQKQLAAVIRMMKDAASRSGRPERPNLRVEFAILSANKNPSGIRLHGVEPMQIFNGLESLRSLPSRWNQIFSKGAGLGREWRIQLFNRVFAGNAPPSARAAFMKRNDRMLLERATVDYELLDSLAANRHLLVRGGAGSGKTWLALEQARRWAEAGKRVLMLCYNIDFAADLATQAAARRLKSGSIEVLSWEALSNRLVESAGIRLARPGVNATREEIDRYYAVTLPTAVLDAVTGGKILSAYDALVVDEGQDHDTGSKGKISWWEIYFSLLVSGKKSPIAVFYDPAQHPEFYKQPFLEKSLRKLLPRAAKIGLQKNRRYTRRILGYLKSLDTDATRPLIEGLSDDAFLDGEEPVIEVCPDFEEARSRAAEFLLKSIREGSVAPDDVLVLCDRNPFTAKNTSLKAFRSLGGHPLLPVEKSPLPDSIRMTSFNKSKGLDARMVIMLHTWPFEDLPSKSQTSYWMAASRARQMLAVFATRKAEAAKV